jgi:hypothetical protein
MCSLCGSDWNVKYYLDELALKGFVQVCKIQSLLQVSTHTPVSYRFSFLTKIVKLKVVHPLMIYRHEKFMISR